MNPHRIMSRMDLEPTIGYPASTGRFRDEQIAQQRTWTVVPEGQRVQTSITVIRVVPSGSTTETFVNPLDPGESFYWDKGDKSDWGAVKAVKASR